MHSLCSHRIDETITSNRDLFYKWVLNISQTGIRAIKDLCLSFLHTIAIIHLNYRRPRTVTCFKRFSMAFSVAQRPLPIMSVPPAPEWMCGHHHLQPHSALWGSLGPGSKCSSFSLFFSQVHQILVQEQLFFRFNQKRSCPEQISKQMENEIGLVEAIRSLQHHQ